MGSRRFRDRFPDFRRLAGGRDFTLALTSDVHDHAQLMVVSLRILTLLLIVLGVAAPGLSPAISAVGGLHATVICTGSGMRVIHLDANGDPVGEVGVSHDAPCALVHAVADAPAVPATEVPGDFVLAARLGPVRAPEPLVAEQLRPGPRAPPTV